MWETTPEDKALLERIDKLGSNQKFALDSFCKCGGWPGGWVWDNRSGTIRLLKSLTKRGLAIQVNEGRWSPTPELADLYRRLTRLSAAIYDCRRQADKDAKQERATTEGDAFTAVRATIERLRDDVAQAMIAEEKRSETRGHVVECGKELLRLLFDAENAAGSVVAHLEWRGDRPKKGTQS